MLKIAKRFAGTVEPHSVTERWSYTVPEGRHFVLEQAFIEQGRAAAASVARNVISLINVRFPDCDTAIHVIAFNQPQDISPPSAIAIKEAFPHIKCSAGTVVTALTVDSSEGGSIFFSIHMGGTEEDVE